jgi:hypothetical protein
MSISNHESRPAVFQKIFLGLTRMVPISLLSSKILKWVEAGNFVLSTIIQLLRKITH